MWSSHSDQCQWPVGRPCSAATEACGVSLWADHRGDSWSLEVTKASTMLLSLAEVEFELVDIHPWLHICYTRHISKDWISSRLACAGVTDIYIIDNHQWTTGTGCHTSGLSSQEVECTLWRLYGLEVSPVAPCAWRWECSPVIATSSFQSARYESNFGELLNNCRCYHAGVSAVRHDRRYQKLRKGQIALASSLFPCPCWAECCISVMLRL